MVSRGSVLAVLVALAACSPAKTDAPASVAAPSTPTAPVGAVLTTSPDIKPEDIAARDKELADDKWEGRGPGTLAGEASAQWIADEMKRIGLEPGVDGQWFQTVDMVAQTVIPDKSSLSMTTEKGETIGFKYADEAVYQTRRQTEPTVSFKDTDVVFVGYGVVAPEAKWNDYAGVDVKGKTVVMFVNDPGFITNDPKLFNGKAMTYYGRWTYKYEEASRQGAAAALLIHETEPAAYGWDVVRSSWTGEQADLVRADGGVSRTLMEGWITLDKAKEVFAKSGLDIDKLRAAANKPGFKPVVMSGLKASGVITQSVERRQSRNVAGTIRGSEHPDEHVIFTAHWDHLGKGVAKSNDPNEDVINNGAIDNASGVATMLEIAEKMASGEKPKRSVTFIAVTLEESGLLGSAYFADYPFIPLNKIVAGINLDAVQPIGLTKDVTVIGSGASELEDLLKPILKAQGRYAAPDANPQAGYFYRSDHVSLAKKGVPMLYLDTGIDAVNGGKDVGKKIGEDYTTKHYHGPSDEFDPSWDWSGIAQDADTLYQLTSQIANSDKWPNWYKTNEFRSIRDASLKAK